MLNYKYILFFIIMLSILITKLYFNITIEVLDEWFSKDTVVFISYKVLLGSLWFVIGVYSYLYFLPRSLILKINRLSFIELFIILFTIFMFTTFIESLFSDYVASLISDGSLYNWVGPDKPCTCGTPNLPTPSNPNADPLNNAANGVIMTTGFKLAQKSPTLAGKVCCICLGLVAGAGGIVVKNAVGNATSGVGKFIGDTNLTDILNNMFNITGNHGLDLLNLSLFFQKLQFTTIILICYNLFLANINESKLESFLIKFLPSKIVRWYIRSVILFKKTSYIIVICLLVLLLIFNYYSYYCLDFFISNLDKIIEVYFKK